MRRAWKQRGTTVLLTAFAALHEAEAGAAESVPAASAAIAAPLPFKHGEDGIPDAAVVTLLLLVFAGVAVLWAAARRGSAMPWIRRALRQGAAVSAHDASISVSLGTRLNSAVRLHVIDWEGGRLLVAANAAGGVTVLQACPDSVPSARPEGQSR